MDKLLDFEEIKSSIKNKKYQFRGEKVELNDMDVNLESFESASLFTCNEEYNNTNELSKQRTNFAKSTMAAEAQRQVEREKEQLCKNKDLKLEEEIVANMENVLKVSTLIMKSYPNLSNENTLKILKIPYNLNN